MCRAEHERTRFLVRASALFGSGFVLGSGFEGPLLVSSGGGGASPVRAIGLWGAVFFGWFLAALQRNKKRFGVLEASKPAVFNGAKEGAAKLSFWPRREKTGEFPPCLCT